LVGLRGDIVGSWKYDVYFGHGKYNNQTNQAGNVRVSRVQDLLESPTGGTEFCEGGWNPFGQGTLSQACADYVGVVAKDTNRLEQNLAEAVVNGDLFTLPAGNVSLAAGAFYQEQDFKYLPDSVLVPDPATGAADVSGFNAAPAIAGYVNNLDYFGEIYVPIVSDLPLMKLLAFTGGYRFSDHSNSGGSDSYKGELDWQMTDAFRVRGSYQRAVRAPNIGELYSPPSEDNPEVTDPCNADSSVRTGSSAAEARSLCLAQGVPADVINSFSQGTDQIDALQIGNEDLEEETADTYTVGLVWQSTSSNPYLERLSASVDYYNIEIDGVISFISPITVVNRCFNQDGANPNFQLDNFYCNLFGRDVTGNILNLQEILINQATLATTGFDFQVDYSFPLGDRFGDLGFNFVATYVDSFESKATSDSPTLDYKGTIGDNVGEAIPEWKGMLTMTWSIADVTTALTVRYIDAMEHESSVDFGSTDEDVCQCTGVDSITYLDASVNWDLTENFGLRLGIENLTDEDPELYSPEVDSGTDPSVYDVIGRRYFLQGNFKF
jgi:outer membrane receptor protein involved in Fe transport